MSNHHESNEVPQTITPWMKIIFGNLLILVATFVTCSILLLPMLGWGKNILWGFIPTLLAFGLMIMGGAIAVDIPDWRGALVFNPITKTRRVMFPGFNWKLLWEEVEDGKTDLKRELSSGDSAGEIERFPTNDPAEVMEAPIIIHMKLNAGGTPQEAAAHFIRFRSIEEHALVVIVRKEIVKMFGQHYATHEMEQLLDANAIQRAVIENNANNMTTISQLENKYGTYIGVILGPSRPDERTKDMKRTPAIAEAFMDARAILLRPRKHLDGTETTETPGMDRNAADRAALLLDPNTDYTERRQLFDINLQATGVENLRDINIVPGMFSGDDDKKKGNKK